MTSGAREGGGAGAPPPRVLVLGVGNILLGDDGFGVHFVNALQAIPFPSNVQVIEAGTVGHQFLPLFRDVDHLFVIDVVEANDAPGSVFRFSPDDMRFASGPICSLHQMSLIDVLGMAEMTGGKPPHTVIIGVQPKNVSSWSLELSAEVTEAIPKVRELLLRELAQVGAL
jgi:hydrogenase maturation protease